VRITGETWAKAEIQRADHRSGLLLTVAKIVAVRPLELEENTTGGMIIPKAESSFSLDLRRVIVCSSAMVRREGKIDGQDPSAS